MTQCNTVDLSRRSPSYENRLSKYARRGFEVYWGALERQKIDPTIFERSFKFTKGLARLLVLERLPKSRDREDYTDRRRAELGRPTLKRLNTRLRGNLKDDATDETADWDIGDEISSYHSFTIPYGPRWTARRLERTFFARDLLLNAEWNRSKDREVDLHRHPVFFGDVDDVVGDCCGSCPQAVTDEEIEIEQQEQKLYIKGSITFLKDDPGRQLIGSFNPVTDEDWTEMAYVGNTVLLNRAIVQGDLEYVASWCKSNPTEMNARDYTGRTPLQLAAACSTTEIVQCLIESGARLIARQSDGYTALHIACVRGNVNIIRAILEKSEENEAHELAKEDQKTAEKNARRKLEKSKIASSESESASISDGEGTDENLIMVSSEDNSQYSTTQGSFVKIQGETVKRQEEQEAAAITNHASDDEPDYYNINVAAWDHPVTPLHLAIIFGHVEVIQLLVTNFGADVLLPIKIPRQHDSLPPKAVLTLLLGLRHDLKIAKQVTKALLDLGASSAQADMTYRSVLQYSVNSGKSDIVDMLFREDGPAALSVLNHVVYFGSSSYWRSKIIQDSLSSAILLSNLNLAKYLLDKGANAYISFDQYIDAVNKQDPYAKTRNSFAQRTNNDLDRSRFETSYTQPIITAVEAELPTLVLELLHKGASLDQLNSHAYMAVRDGQQNRWQQSLPESLIDLVRGKISELELFSETLGMNRPAVALESPDALLESLPENSYRLWVAKREVAIEQAEFDREMEIYAYNLGLRKQVLGYEKKKMEIDTALHEFRELEKVLVQKGAKKFVEMHPDIRLTDKTKQQPTTTMPGGTSRPFNIEFDFQWPNLSEAKKARYVQLFEAVWNNDVSTVKEITLGVGERPNNHDDQLDRQPLLAIAVKDKYGFSPFLIALLRGHFSLAKTCFEIANAQFRPADDDERKKVYHLRSQHMQGDYEYDSESSDESEDGTIRFRSTLIDDQYTIENIQTVSDEVRCESSALDVLNWQVSVSRIKNLVPQNPKSQQILSSITDSHPPPSINAFEYAIIADSAEIMTEIVKLCQAFPATTTRQSQSFLYFCQRLFEFAIKHDCVQAVELMISNFGSGLPLDKVLASSGLTEPEKPLYYKGLSVRGKKRKDWADAGRGIYSTRKEEHRSPVLVACSHSSVESARWLRSDLCKKRYLEYARTHKDDELINVLAKSERGLQAIIEHWVSEMASDELLLHVAVTSCETGDRYEKLLTYIIDTVNGSLDNKSSDGFTALHVAMAHRRKDAVRLLIKAGADQRARDKHGRNALHHLLAPPKRARSVEDDELQSILAMFNQDAIQEMLLEKSSLHQLGSTPISAWFGIFIDSQFANGDLHSAALAFLLEFVSGSSAREAFRQISSDGNFPMHMLVKMQRADLIRLLAEWDPSLLFMENASGKTATELIHNEWVGEVSNGELYSYPRQAVSLIRRDASEFLPEKERLAQRETTSDLHATFDLIRSYERKFGDSVRRELVSLHDASEVARRLATRSGPKFAYDKRARSMETVNGDLARWLRIE